MRRLPRAHHIGAASGRLQIHQRLLRRLLAQLRVAAGACEPRSGNEGRPCTDGLVAPRACS